MISINQPQFDAAMGSTLAAMKRMAKDSPTEYGKSLYLFFAHVVTKAMRYCPVDTGTLRQSRWLSEPSTSGTSFHLETGFWVYYAAAVHNSRRKLQTGRRRFLAVALDEESSKLPRFMASAVKAMAQNKPGPFTALHPTQPMIGPQLLRTESEREALYRDHGVTSAASIKERRRTSPGSGRRRGPVFGGNRGST